MNPDFESMNETDVREIIVRPLLHRLGYAHGAKANIRTEVPLTYSHHFLGRKKPGKDPKISGRADYICDATPFGRWVVEVKAPHEAIGRPEIEQAHTYCAHPEIAALYFLLSNGRRFELYATAHLSEPLLAWDYCETDQNFMQLFNTVGYDAIERLRSRLTVDPKKPLGPGLKSLARIAGGRVLYGSHSSDHPLFASNPFDNLSAGITGGAVSRTDDGRLMASIDTISPMQQMQILSGLPLDNSFEFFCFDEFISADAGRPNIFQNYKFARIRRGHHVTRFQGDPGFAMPFDMDSSAFSEAVGFLKNDEYHGAILMEYRFEILAEPTGNLDFDRMIASLPKVANITGVATFDLVLRGS